MDRGEYLEELRTGKDDLLQIYDELVKDGDIEDFLKEEEQKSLALLNNRALHYKKEKI